jgi:hypothetical protein
VIVAGLAVRLVIAPFVAHPFDVQAWYVVGQSLFDGTKPVWGFLEPYSYSLFLFAFPATAAFRALSGIAGSYSIPMASLDPRLNPGSPWNITVVPGPLFDLLVKLPLIASDALVALLIHRLVRREAGDERLATSASLLWFLNPLVIWVSSGWGMFDTLPALFTVLALYLVLGRRFAYSGVSLALAVAMKYYAVVLVIPLLLLAWRRGGRRGFAESLGGVALAGAALFAPLIVQTAEGFASLATGPTPAGLYYSGLSFWSAISLSFAGVPIGIISGATVVALLGAAYVWMIRSNTEVGLESASVYFGLPVLVLLLAFRFVGENYFVWLLPFASVLALRSRRIRSLYWAVSLVALVSSMTDSLLPYYLLPAAPWIGGYLVEVLQAVAPYRVAPQGSVTGGLSLGKLLLSALGVSAAAVLTMTAREWAKSLRARLNQ